MSFISSRSVCCAFSWCRHICDGCSCSPLTVWTMRSMVDGQCGIWGKHVNTVGIIVTVHFQTFLQSGPQQWTLGGVYSDWEMRYLTLQNSDLPGHTAPGGGSIPPELCVTSQKPDIVIIDNHMKAIHLYELTCPAERNIDTRNNEKSNKYAHFTTDITHLSCKVNCFEVSTKGFLNTRNHSTLNTLHKFVKPGITKTQFKSNISALSLTASYHIFLCKDEPTFMEPPFLLPPLVTKTKTVIAI